MMKKKLFFLLFLIFILSSLNSLADTEVNFVRPKTAGVISASTSFDYNVSLTTNSDCSGMSLSRRTSITTDNYGVAFIPINISSLNGFPRYKCEYRGADLALRKIHNVSSAIFDKLVVSRYVNSSEGFYSDDGTFRGNNLLVTTANITNANITGNVNAQTINVYYSINASNISGNISFDRLYNYPSSCSIGEFINRINDTFPCANVTRIDGSLNYSFGRAVVSSDYFFGRNNDAINRLQSNVPNGAAHEYSVEDITKILINGTHLLLDRNGTAANSSSMILQLNANDGTSTQRAIFISHNGVGNYTQLQILNDSGANILSLDSSTGRFILTNSIQWNGIARINPNNFTLGAETATLYTLNAPAGSILNFSIGGLSVFDSNSGSMRIYPNASMNRFAVFNDSYSLGVRDEGGSVLSLNNLTDNVVLFPQNWIVNWSRTLGFQQDSFLHSQTYSVGRTNYSVFNDSVIFINAPFRKRIIFGTARTPKLMINDSEIDLYPEDDEASQNSMPLVLQAYDDIPQIKRYVIQHNINSNRSSLDFTDPNGFTPLSINGSNITVRSAIIFGQPASASILPIGVPSIAYDGNRLRLRNYNIIDFYTYYNTSVMELGQLGNISMMGGVSSGSQIRRTLDINGTLNVQRSGSLIDISSIAYFGGNVNVSENVSASGTLNSGTYTPGIIPLANFDNQATNFTATYIRLGNTVTASGRIDVNVNTGSQLTKYGWDLPFTSDIGNDYDCTGTAAARVSGFVASMYGNTTNNSILLDFVTGDTSNVSLYYTYQCRII